MELSYYIVTPETISSIETVRSLYLDSFPEEERRPWESIISLIESGAPFFKFIIAKNQNDEVVGFYSLWRFPEARYIEHFAITPALRGKGLGSILLAHIVESANGLPVVVEVEPADKSKEAAARIRFYEKAGLNGLYDFEYVQPPYAKGLPEVPMMLMTTAPINDIELFVLQLHTLVYNK